MKFPSNLRLAILRFSLFVLAFQLLGVACAQYVGTNGIFAEFNTSMGSFTCRLDYVVAPKAVANFISLATGQRAWLDVPSGQIRTNPFYSGITFHRVITNFMNQAGSRNGLGTDGPGYQFPDEFNPLAKHEGFGVLSMANAGPDSNGSQFFITVGTQTNLNNIHTVFGRLYGGSNVVYAINRVATTNSRPISDVTLNNVAIRRVGTAAENFNIHAQGLPLVTNLALAIARSGTNVSLSFGNRLSSENRYYSSTNLQNWSGGSFGIQVREPLVNMAIWSTALPAEFFRFVQIQYADQLHTPRNAVRVVNLTFSSGWQMILGLNGESGGIYNSNFAGSGNILYEWKQDPYRARLAPLVVQGFPFPFGIHLDYDTPTNGTFKGNIYLSYPSAPADPVSGVFTSGL